MAKQLVTFVCQECGYESPQWLGKCPECGMWNTLREFHESQNSKFKNQNYNSKLQRLENETKPKTLKEISFQKIVRLDSGFGELNTVLGGGIVPGSVTLVAGDPGIGKSTLLLQLALNVASQGESVKGKASSSSILKDQNSKEPSLPFTVNPSPLKEPKVLYVSGEESVEQIKLRATRIKGALENENFLLVSLNNTDAIVQLIAKEKPSLVIIDSIQTVESEALDGLSG